MSATTLVGSWWFLNLQSNPGVKPSLFAQAWLDRRLKKPTDPG